MNFVWAVFKRELKSYFVSPLAYVAIAVFLLVQGLLFAWALRAYEMARIRAASNPMAQVVPVETLIRSLLGDDLIWALFLIVPLLTMRLLAEERRQHTAELLLTAPMTTRQLVLGKFLGSTAVLLVMLGLTAWMPLTLRMWGNCDPGVIMAGFLGAVLYGAFLMAVGLLASSLTESIMVAAFITLLLVAVINVLGPLASTLPYIGGSLEQFTPVGALQRLARGVLDSQALIYFLTCTYFVLDLTARVVDSQRWR